MEKIVNVHFPGIKKQLLREALERFSRSGGAGAKEKAVDIRASRRSELLVAEDISPEALHSPDITRSFRRCTARSSRTSRIGISSSGLCQVRGGSIDRGR